MVGADVARHAGVYAADAVSSRADTALENITPLANETAAAVAQGRETLGQVDGTVKAGTELIERSGPTIDAAGSALHAASGLAAIAKIATGAQALSTALSVVPQAVHAFQTVTGTTNAAQIAQHVGDAAGSMGNISHIAKKHDFTEFTESFPKYVHTELVYMSLKFQKELHRDFCLVVYHPSDLWHGGFEEALQQKPIHGFAGMSTDLETLLKTIEDIRKKKELSSEEPVIIFMPSRTRHVHCRAYRIEPEMQPLRFCGKLDEWGNPLVHIQTHGAKIEKLENIGHKIYEKPVLAKGIPTNVPHPFAAAFSEIEIEMDRAVKRIVSDLKETPAEFLAFLFECLRKPFDW